MKGSRAQILFVRSPREPWKAWTIQTSMKKCSSMLKLDWGPLFRCHFLDRWNTWSVGPIAWAGPFQCLRSRFVVFATVIDLFRSKCHFINNNSHVFFDRILLGVLWPSPPALQLKLKTRLFQVSCIVHSEDCVRVEKPSDLPVLC